MKHLCLADDLALPLSFATKTAAILAQRRKGKTYLASVIAEEMVTAKQPFVALDPTGAWWGLRASADGKRAGLPVVILGGEHGDVDIQRTAGRVVADLVVDEPGFYVIDFSRFESGEAERQFAVDFAERLYRAKARARFPLHLFVDEADRFIPQVLRKGSGETSPRLLGAFEAIVRRGGLRGLGTTLISQRASVVNKNVLEMLDVLFVLRTVGPNDRKAIDGYIQAHGSGDERRALMESLASLAIGEAWVWEPGSEPALFRRVQIRQRTTFNSSATPEGDTQPVEPRRLAPVDLEALTKRMAATIERAKADDPRELRKQIAQASRDAAASARRIKDLEARLASTSGFSSSNEKAKQEVRVLTDADRALLEQLRQRVAAVEAGLHEASARALERVTTTATKAVNNAAVDFERFLEDSRERFVQLFETKRVQRLLAKLDPVLTPSRIPGTRESTEIPQKGLVAGLTGAARQPRPSPAAGPAVNGHRPVEARILSALAELEQLGARAPARPLVAMLAGYSHLNSKGFVNALGALRSSGLVEYPSGGAVALTDTGRASAEPPEVPRTPHDVQQRVIGLLGGASGRILQPLIDAYPGALPRADVAAAAGYGHLNSKGFVNAVGRLRTLGFVDYPDRGTIRAQPVLFLEDR